MRACAITTVDNPFDPFDEFKEWFMWDVHHGHNSCSYLMRIARTSEGLTDAENNAEIERAIDEIIELDLMHEFRKVVRDIPEYSTPTGGGSRE